MRSLAPLSVLLLVVYIAAALAVGLSAPLGPRGATVIVAAVLVVAAVACGALNAQTVTS